MRVEPCELLSFSASLDDAKCESMERHAGSNAMGILRRLALVACSRDSETLLRLAKNDPDMFAEMLSGVRDFERHISAVQGVAAVAVARLEAVAAAAQDAGNKVVPIG